jgi:hypothetical protein
MARRIAAAGSPAAAVPRPWYRSRSRSLLTCTPNRRHGRGRRASGAGQAGWRWLPGRCSASSCSTPDARGHLLDKRADGAGRRDRARPPAAARQAAAYPAPDRRARAGAVRHRAAGLAYGPIEGNTSCWDRQLSPARSPSPCWRWAASPSRGGTCRCGTTAPLAVGSAAWCPHAGRQQRAVRRAMSAAARPGRRPSAILTTEHHGR